MAKIKFVNLGCPKNLVDSELLAGKLKRYGHSIVKRDSSAKFLIINTCSFIEDARKEAMETIFAGVEWKEAVAGRRLYVMGCLPERYRQQVREEIPEVDGFFGIGDFENLLDIIPADKRIEKIRRLRTYPFTPGHYRYLRIADGCDNRCNFCAIPLIRGSYRSRPIDDLASEAAMLVGSGAKELIITAQETTGYGSDLKDGENLVKLLERLESESGAQWIRVMYMHPPKLEDSLIELMADSKIICPYFDLPLEHISDKILRRMGRRITRAEIEQKLTKIKTALPQAALRTSLITGYPGETEGDFHELLDFIDEGWFDWAGVFIYSPEEGTPAYALKGTVEPMEAEFRYERLMETQREVSLAKNQRRIGRRYQVIIDSASPKGNSIGRSMLEAPEIDGFVVIEEYVKPGSLITAEITAADDYILTGVLVKDSECEPFAT